MSPFLKALHGKNRGAPPVWLMRQAGRYLPEYRAMRSKYSFLEMAKRRDLIVETTLLPLQRFDLDAAILFSDILLPFELLGFSIDYAEGGPKVIPGRKEKADFHEIGEAILRLKEKLHVPLIGFCGAAYTLSRYGVADGLTEATGEFLQLQLDSGVDAVQLFDTWAGKLDPESFRELALPSLRALAERVHAKGVPLMLFTLNGAAHLDALLELKPHGISLGSEVNMAEMRRKLPLALQGNLAPELLTGDEAPLMEALEKLLSEMHGDPGFIVNLAHGITPQAKPELVSALVKRVKATS